MKNGLYIRYSFYGKSLVEVKNNTCTILQSDGSESVGEQWTMGSFVNVLKEVIHKRDVVYKELTPTEKIKYL